MVSSNYSIFKKDDHLIVYNYMVSSISFSHIDCLTKTKELSEFYYFSIADEILLFPKRISTK